MKNTEEEHENIIKKEIPREDAEEEKESPKKKSQAEMIQDALGLTEEQITSIEKKLFIARFLDYFSEETFDFIFKEDKITQYREEIENLLEKFASANEEDKLLQKRYKEKQIYSVVEDLKKNAEELAAENGVNKPVETKLKRLSLIVTLPTFAVLIVLTFVLDPIFILPFVCLFCMVPQLLRGYVVKKWMQFKEAHKTEYYKQNRDDILVIKGFVNEVLSNIRTTLLDWEVPLQLIKFVLHSSDYDNLNLLNQRKAKGTYQYVFTFDYPDDVEPFPIPDALKGAAEMDLPQGLSEETETNFVVLTNVQTENGKIKSFIPALRDNMAEQINNMLNESEFEETSKEIDDVIPNYPEEDVIYCVCGEVAEIEDIRECTWKGQFNYYLFESAPCNCGDQVYALSVMDENASIPQELKNIF